MQPANPLLTFTVALLFAFSAHMFCVLSFWSVVASYHGNWFCSSKGWTVWWRCEFSMLSVSLLTWLWHVITWIKWFLLFWLYNNNMLDQVCPHRVLSYFTIFPNALWIIVAWRGLVSGVVWVPSLNDVTELTGDSDWFPSLKYTHCTTSALINVCTLFISLCHKHRASDL